MTRALLAVVTALAAGVAAAQAPSPPPPGSARAIAGEVCAGCHGADLAGGRAPSLTDAKLLAARTDAQLYATITNGIAGTEMPGFKQACSDQQIWELVTHLRTNAARAKGPPAFVADPADQVVRSEKQAFRIEVVARGLVTPWGFTFLPDGRLLVSERPGRVRIIDKAGRLLPAPISGLPTPFTTQDAGYFDIAAHPDYARNGWIYLSYAERLAGSPDPAPLALGQRTENPPSMTVLVRGRIDARNRWIDNQVLYRAPPALYTPSGSHYGSRFLFDGKGHVFYSLGERGDITNSQRLDTPLGKIHRINDDGSVPADNPFVGRLGAVPTIWSYGHRNPEGFAFEPATGALWESEHGPNAGDEINVIVKGGNYGWGVASMGIEAGITRRSAPGMIDPVAYYVPTLAPSGIHFYTGTRYPKWRGSLFVAGLVGQQLRRLEVKDGTVTHQEVVFAQFGRTRAVTTGPDGLIYLLLQNPTGPGTGTPTFVDTPGMVVRLVPIP